MAARIFTSAGVNNLWSNVANWDGGATIPAEDDSVTIPTAQTCEYDYNSAYTTGIAGITITGTLSLTRTTGTYRLFMKAATTIGGAGTFDCGTSGSIIPFAAKHTITGGANWYVNGAAGLTMTVYTDSPAIKSVKITATEPIGETVLAVDTDVRGDVWTTGDEVVVYRNAKDSSTREENTIAGIAAGTITISVGLTAAKYAGNYIILMTRNVKFLGNTEETIQAFASGKLTIAGGLFSNVSAQYSVFNCVSPTISGGAFLRGIYSVSASPPTISSGVFAVLGTLVYGGAIFSGGEFWGNTLQVASSTIFFGGTFIGGTYLMNEVTTPAIFGGDFSYFYGVCVKGSGAVVYGGSFSYNTWAFGSSTILIKNATFSNNSTSDINASQFTAFNTTFGSATEISLYTSLSRYAYSESFDHDQEAGAFKSWTKGGVTTKQTTTKPTGYTYSMETVLADANNEGFWEQAVVVSAGASVDINMNLRKSASMTYLPRIIIFNKASTDPFAGGAGINTFTMTDSIDTWEASEYVYTNTGTESVTLVIRCQGKNASGSMFSLVDVEFINVDLTSTLAKLDIIDTVVDAIKVKTDAQKNATLLVGGEIIV